MTNIRRLMVGVAVATAVLAGCDPYSKASTVPPAIVGVTATNGSDATQGTQTSGAWTIDGATSSCVPGAGVQLGQPIIFVTFNKQMDPASVQTSVTDCTPAGGWLKVTDQANKDVTSSLQDLDGNTLQWFSCYDPSSPTSAEGGSAILFLAPMVSGATGTGTTTCTDAVTAAPGWNSATAAVAGAVNITTLHFTGSVKDKEGRSQPVDVTANFDPNPGLARNLTAAATTADTVTLTWTDRPCAATATGIVDEIRTKDANGDYTKVVGTVPYVVATNNPQTFTVTGADATAPASYALFVVVSGAAPFEQQQATLTGVVPGLPAAPKPSAAMSAGNKLPVVVTTGDPAATAGVDDFDVYRASYSKQADTAAALNAVGAFSRLGNVGKGHTTFPDNSAALNSRYVYALVPVKTIAGTRARGADTLSDRFVTPPAPPVAGTPSDVRARSVTVEWNYLPGTISSSNSAVDLPVLGLTLQRADDVSGQPGATWTTVASRDPATGVVTPPGSIVATSSTTTIDAKDATALPSTTYWYRLVATNTAGSANGTPVSTKTLALQEPTGVTGTRSGSTVTVSWVAPSPADGVTGYSILRSLTDACGWKPVASVTGATTLTYDDATAPANVSYIVVSTGAGGIESAQSDPSALVP